MTFGRQQEKIGLNFTLALELAGSWTHLVVIVSLRPNQLFICKIQLAIWLTRSVSYIGFAKYNFVM